MNNQEKHDLKRFALEIRLALLEELNATPTQPTTIESEDRTYE